MRSRIESTRPLASVSFSGGTFGGGGGGGVPRMFSRIHLPRSTGEVRLAYDVTVRMLPWPRSPPRTLSSPSETRRKRLPYTFGNAVVLGQPLVHERVVRAQQVEHAAVFADDALEEQLGLAPERLAQVVVEVGERRASGLAAARFRRYSHWPAKLVTSASARGSASIRLHLPLEHRRRD